MPRYKPNWKCTRCDHSCNFIEDTIQDWKYLPYENSFGEPSDVAICGIRCPQCNDLQAIRLKGTIKSGLVKYRNMNSVCVLGDCYCLFCENKRNRSESTPTEGVKFATEIYEWGVSVVAHCVGCGVAKDSRYTDFILLRGKQMNENAEKLEKRQPW
jgi:hypothetical protein